MIRNRKSVAWGFRIALALGLIGLAGLVLLWSQSQAPGVGFPDRDIRPLFASAQTEVLSRKRSLGTGSIHDIIEPVKPAAKPIHAIFVYVHGISCHSPDYSAPFQFRLAKALGMTRENSAGGAPVVSIVDLTAAGPKPATVPEYLSTDDFAAWSALATPGEVKSHYLEVRQSKKVPQEFAPACSNAETGHLVRPLDHPRLSIRHFANQADDRLSMVEVLWSPLSERQKLMKVGEDLNLDASSMRAKPPWPHDKPAPRADVEVRAIANQMLKASVINGAIADAIFYLGDGGPAIRAAVMAGLMQATELRKQTEAEYKRDVRMTVVTESLGSRIAFDTMREAPDRFANELEHTVALLKGQLRVVMFANQLPLLDIAEQSDRSMISGGSFADDIARHAARVQALADAGDREAGSDDYRYSSRADPPSWRACGEAFRYYVRVAETLDGTPLRTRLVGKSARELADNLQFALTHPLAPVASLFDGAANPAAVNGALDSAKRFSANAMAFLGFSPGGIGYANCQQKVAQERARLDAHYLKPTSPPPPSSLDAVANAERLLKIAADVRDARIADIDAISNARASTVFGLLYLELKHLSSLCAKPGADPGTCNEASIKARLRRVAELVPRIEILAFSDPNDLLSYRVTAEQYESETFAFTNIPIRLADPIIPAAGRWGGFTPPMEAHTNHKFDNRILAMVVCGWDKSRGRTFEVVNGMPCPLQMAPASH